MLHFSTGIFYTHAPEKPEILSEMTKGHQYREDEGEKIATGGV
jgi:hypothetical protein